MKRAMAHHEVYREGAVHVMAERCSSCIYRKGGVQLVSLKRMQTETEEAEGFIPCHQTYEPLRKANAKPAICRGYWDAADLGFALRLAQAMELIEFDPVPT